MSDTWVTFERSIISKCHNRLVFISRFHFFVFRSFLKLICQMEWVTVSELLFDSFLFVFFKVIGRKPFLYWSPCYTSFTTIWTNIGDDSARRRGGRREEEVVEFHCPIGFEASHEYHLHNFYRRDERHTHIHRRAWLFNSVTLFPSFLLLFFFLIFSSS